MDFLDPRHRRFHRYRLLIGYGLVAIVIGLATVILVYAAYGYGINTKTGQIIENGLLFADSKPGGADIYLDGKLQSSKTAARLVLNAGTYDLTIKKAGYRQWQRDFVLEEHSVARYVYPLLFPTKPTQIPIKNYNDVPSLMTQSPDRRWLLVQVSPADSANLTFDEYDTNALSKPPQEITIPGNTISAGSGSQYKEVEWSTNNNNLLLEHTFAGGHEFLIINRSKPEDSFNVNRLLKVEPTAVALKNKKIDQLYIYNQPDASLQIGDSGQATLAPPFLRHVLAFKPYGNTLLTYATDNSAPAGKAVIRIWDDGKTYPLYSVNAGATYLLDAAQFQGHWYYAAGSDTTERINIFKDPIDYIKNPQYGKAVPTISLSVMGASKLKFSENTRFIGAQGGQNFAVYDLETHDNYHYKLKAPLQTPLDWMDGHRWLGLSGNQVFVVDYDDTNAQLVTPSVISDGAFFSRDYNQMITVVPQSGGGVTLTRVDLRAGTDLPKDLSQ